MFLVEVLNSSPNASKKGGFTPYLYACKNGSLHIMKYLERMGADPLKQAENGLTALHVVSQSGKIDAVHHLIEVHKL